MRVCALQSGTSADGIDVLVVDADVDGPVLVLRPMLWRTVAWAEGLRREILDVSHGAVRDAAAWCALDTRLGEAFADTVREIDGLDLVVSHGQTLYHWAEGTHVRGTLQLGEPSLIAEAARCPVVSHVRHSDIAAGGAGAPLMAVFDRLWLGTEARRAQRALVTVNIGGIANVQVVHPDGSVDAADTGPGNALLDAHVDRLTGGRAGFDRDGKLAARGRVHAPLLEEMRAHPYFAAGAGTSTGRHEFDLRFVDDAIAAAAPSGVSDADLAATLVELTATTIAAAVRPACADQIIVSGGGVRNPVVMSRLRELLAPAPVVASSAHGVDPDAKENLLFAVLGILTWHGIPVSLTTPDARVAGRISPGPAPLAMPAPRLPFDRLEIHA